MMVCLAMFFVLVSGAPKQSFSLTDYFSGEYYAYTQNPASENYIYLGFCYMNKGKVATDELLGESMVIKNFEPISAIKTLNAKIVKTEVLKNGAVVIYAYTSLISNNVKIENELVNLQIAYYENHSVIGWPLILGSF